MKRNALLALVSLLLFAEPAAAATPDTAIAGVIAQAQARAKTPGISIAVERDGAVVYARGFGYSDADAKRPVDPATYFEIGSVTKQFTATAIAMLAADGKLDLEDLVARYLPDAPHASEVTIRQLLNHVSGIPDYLAPDVDQYAYSTTVTPAELYRIVARQPLAFTPGTRFSYSNTNYVVLGAIVERVSGMTYAAFLHSRVFREASFAGISYGAPDGRPVSKGYVKMPAYRDPTPIPTWKANVAFSAGGLYATPTELVHWDDAFFNGRVVPQQTVTTLTTAPELPAGAVTVYAAGWFRGSVDGHPEIWHNGAIPGFVAANAYFPDEHLAIAIEANMGNIDLGGTIKDVFRTFVPPTAAQLAADDLSAAGEDPAITAIARRAWADGAAGTVDRSLLDARMSAALTDERIAQFAPVLRGLGTPEKFVYDMKSELAGYTVYVYRVFTPGGVQIMTLSIDADGKIGGIFYRPR